MTMTDTQTAATTTTEDETMQAFTKIGEFVAKARDAIINASQLAKEVAELRSQFDALKVEIEDAHRKNADFEQQLAFVRKERDDALALVEAARIEQVNLSNALEALKAEHETLKSAHEAAESRALELRFQRDDAVMEARRLTEALESSQREHSKLVAELERIHEMLQPRPAQPRNEVGQFQSPTEEPKQMVSW